MPCRHAFLDGHDLLVQCYEGLVRFSEQRSMLERTVEDPRYHASMCRLIDASGLQSSEIDLSMLLLRRERLIGHFADLGETVRWGYFAPTDTGYGVSRMAVTIFAEVPNLQLQIFDHREDVLGFVGAAPSALAPWVAFVEGEQGS